MAGCAASWLGGVEAIFGSDATVGFDEGDVGYWAQFGEVGAGLLMVGVGAAAATASNFGATPSKAGGVVFTVVATALAAGFVPSVSTCGVAPLDGSLVSVAARASASAPGLDQGFQAQREPPPDLQPVLTATRKAKATGAKRVIVLIAGGGRRPGGS